MDHGTRFTASLQRVSQFRYFVPPQRDGRFGVQQVSDCAPLSRQCECIALVSNIWLSNRTYRAQILTRALRKALRPPNAPPGFDSLTDRWFAAGDSLSIEDALHQLDDYVLEHDIKPTPMQPAVLSLTTPDQARRGTAGSNKKIYPSRGRVPDITICSFTFLPALPYIFTHDK